MIYEKKDETWRYKFASEQNVNTCKNQNVNTMLPNQKGCHIVDIEQLKHEFTTLLYNSVLIVMLFLKFLQQSSHVVFVVISFHLYVPVN